MAGETHFPTGFFGAFPTGTPPGTPTISVQVSGTTATVSVTGDGNITHTVRYYKLTDGGIQEGGSRIGDGDIEVAGLDARARYLLWVTSENEGSYSLPSKAVSVYIPPSASVDPTGPVAIAMKALSEMLAESLTFQEAIGATGTDEEKKAYALGFIHLANYEPDDNWVRPCILICRPGSEQSHLIAGGTFQSRGELEVWIEQDIPAVFQDVIYANDAEMYFSNFYEAVASEAKTLSAKPGYLITRSWNVTDGPARFRDEPVYIVKLTVAYGLEG
ncbi:MAG: hypothetical protein JXA82_18125 [Sedimentisphaerales bacterium]|nr:hypothetical protein [Sedimentisphaerales bacterium]